jgi:5-hydroxyisourate hydrolase-like protein (transthyretin family)
MRHSERAITALAKIMDSDAAPESARIAAASAILDRAHGKPSQHVTADVTHISHEQALQAIAERAGLVIEAQAVAVEDEHDRTQH